MNRQEGTGLSERRFARILSLIIVILLGVVCVYVVLLALDRDVRTVFFSIPVAVALLVSMIVKVFALHSFNAKIACYVIDSVLLVLLNFFSGWTVSVNYTTYCYLVYVIVLSEFYLSAPRLRDNLIMFCVNFAAYTALYVIIALYNRELASAFDISSQFFLAAPKKK